MIINFKTVQFKRYGETLEDHVVEVDGKLRFDGSECVEPEDTYFCRCLPDPHACESVMREIALRAKTEEIIFTHETVNEEE